MTSRPVTRPSLAVEDRKSVDDPDCALKRRVRRTVRQVEQDHASAEQELRTDDCRSVHSTDLPAIALAPDLVPVSAVLAEPGGLRKGFAFLRFRSGH